MTNIINQSTTSTFDRYEGNSQFIEIYNFDNFGNYPDGKNPTNGIDIDTFNIGDVDNNDNEILGQITETEYNQDINRNNRNSNFKTTFATIML